MAIHNKVLNTVSLEFSAVARAMANGGDKIISLGLGEPGFPTPPEIIDAAHKSMLKGETRYSSPWGTPELLKLLEARIQKQSGIEVKPNQIIVTLGAKQALSLVLTSILEENDEVIVFTPCFVSFIPQIFMAENKAKVIELPLNNDFSINFEALSSAISPKTKAIIVNYPNNPTGQILSLDPIRKLIEICKSNKIHLISDEVYSTLLVSNNSFRSLSSYWNEYENIFIIDGFSKAYSMTGWRIGYLAGPAEYIKRVAVLQQHLNTNIPVFIQRGAEVALNLPSSFYEKYNNVLTENEHCLYERMKDSKELIYTRSQGGMFAFINISKLTICSDAFCTGLLKRYNVAATPGKVFGKDWDSFVRVSLGGECSEFVLACDLFVKYAAEVYDGK